MGNQPSSSTTTTTNNNITLPQAIDFIATNLILTQNFKDMKRLSNMDYCNNLVILTSDAIEKNLKYSNVYYLSQRLRSGEQVNEMTNQQVLFIKKNNLNEMDIQNQTNKRRMCIGIAKFYIKIAHVFASIMSTINPTYSYKTPYGETKLVSLLEKSKLPPGVNTKLENINLCGNRINTLTNQNNYNVDSNTNVVINPNFCKMNYNNFKGVDKKLGDEPGIPELQQLYYDKYDYDQGGFGGKSKMEDNMSSEMYNQYKKDLLSFYKAFTGNKEIPIISNIDQNGNITKEPSIQKFSDIPLRSYHRYSGCKSDGVFQKEYRGTLKERLFSEYAKHIKQMLKKTEDVQGELLKILDKMFVYGENPETKIKTIVIDPLLTERKLQEIVTETRKIIMNLYLTCEEDFVKGLDIFEAIVETQIKETSLSQINQLERALDQTVSRS